MSRLLYFWTGLCAGLVLWSCAAHADYKSQMLADSPWAFFRQDDGSSNTAMVDVSGNSRNGTWQVSPFHPTTTGGLLAHDNNSAEDFDGTDDWGSAAGTFFSSVTDFTVEAWVRFDATSGNPKIFGQSGTCGTECLLWLDLAGTGMRATVWNTSNGATSYLQCAPAGGLSTATIYHLAVIYTSATSLRCILNTATTFLSKDSTSTTITGTQNTGTQGVLFGALETCAPGTACPSDLLDGVLDEVSFKQSIIADSHIRAHWQWGFGMQPKRRR